MIIFGKDADRFIQQLHRKPSKEKLNFLKQCEHVYKKLKQ